MLEDYFKGTTSPEEQRLLAVQAALEIIKASVSASNAYAARDKLVRDLEVISAKVSETADAIQASLLKK